VTVSVCHCDECVCLCSNFECTAKLLTSSCVCVCVRDRNLVMDYTTLNDDNVKGGTRSSKRSSEDPVKHHEKDRNDTSFVGVGVELGADFEDKKKEGVRLNEEKSVCRLCLFVCFCVCVCVGVRVCMLVCVYARVCLYLCVRRKR